MTRKQGTVKTHRLAALIIRALKSGAHNATSLGEAAGIHRDAASAWIKALREHLYIKEWSRDSMGRVSTPLWSWSVGGEQDAPRPPVQSAAEVRRRWYLANRETARAASLVRTQRARAKAREAKQAAAAPPPTPAPTGTCWVGGNPFTTKEQPHERRNVRPRKPARSHP